MELVEVSLEFGGPALKSPHFAFSGEVVNCVEQHIEFTARDERQVVNYVGMRHHVLFACVTGQKKG